MSGIACLGLQPGGDRLPCAPLPQGFAAQADAAAASAGALNPTLYLPYAPLPQGFAAQADAAAASAGALNPNEFRALKLIKKEKLTPNTNLYRWGGGQGAVISEH